MVKNSLKLSNPNNKSKTKKQIFTSRLSNKTPKKIPNYNKKDPSKLKKKAFNQLKNHSHPLEVLEVYSIQSPKVSIMMTSHKEPNLANAIKAILSQDVFYPYELVIISPDEEARKLVSSYRKNANVRFFKDKGVGKSAAINEVLKEVKGDILIFTDGDVTLLPGSINAIIKQFENPRIGCVSGRVISANPKDNMFGFWSHLLADAGAHNIRKHLYERKQFLECTGYLFAFRNHIIKQIPVDVAEDTIIPYFFKKGGYEIGYAEQAKVFVKNPTSWKDWINQRKRTAKAHEALGKYVDTNNIPRVKSFSNELSQGVLWALEYPKTIQEYFWTFLLFVARLYMWLLVFYETRLLKEPYADNWKKIKSAS